MLYDLNLPWSPATPSDRLSQTLSLASSLGYAVVALNHSLELPLPAKPAPPPFPLLSVPGSDAASESPRVLRRATLKLADPAAFNFRLPALAAVYDVLAIRPLTEKAFQNACLSLEVPLISLDLTTHFPFHFRPKPCMAAVSRGVRFELCYAQLLAADSRGRANFIANVAGLVRATRGRGFVISSEANFALALRAPADVVNLMSVWGLASEKGLDGLRCVPRSIVVNEAIKRRGYRGVVDVVQVASRKVETADSPDGDSAATTTSQKRKVTDVPSMSKRKAKKLKMAARATASEITES
ncbi:hypothetical protein L249_4590 [Ophiocordyceps polyrhachis-furcata BCC 54312]|uniref:RNase P subunit p30 n=1 Tax=Ophiocordyceps polyrhachis-furcata BCC 54312 TaxID=1330021 RepID=A0A367LC14_9HYPO|nr:hypothetical protein L249_4590 [Ophiocordyceps polyrhachis-furcata BCC 54312]